MKKKEKEILIQEYKLLRNEFLKVVENGKIKSEFELMSQKIDTPYLCKIIRKIFGSNSPISDHFHSVLESFSEKAPKTYEAVCKQDKHVKRVNEFAPFHYREVKLRLMLIDEIIESLS